MTDGGLFGGIYGAGECAAEVSDAAWLQAMLDFEGALARAGEAAGLIPTGARAAISTACHVERFDPEELGPEAARHASPAVPLIAALRRAVGPDHADHVHVGATSQDVIDTAAMLVSRRALGVILDDAAEMSRAGAALARRHVDTPMMGRTLLQQALPVSFGLVAAGWSVGVHEAAMRLSHIWRSELRVQLGGPVGTGSPRLAESVPPSSVWPPRSSPGTRSGSCPPPWLRHSACCPGRWARWPAT